jgi:hypothetical protein
MLGIRAPAERRARPQGARAGSGACRDLGHLGDRGEYLETGDDHAGSGRPGRWRAALRGAGARSTTGSLAAKEAPDILPLMTPLP